MKITSLEIKQHEFERSFRGYNVDEVNQFLGDLAQEWDKMFNEIKMLKMQLDIAEKEASKLREVEMTLIKTLRTAEDTSSRIAETAQAEATRKIESAEQEAAKTIESAKLEAAKTIEEAQLKAAQLVKEAEHTGKQLILEAETKALDIQKTSEKAIAELDTRYNHLERKKNELLSKLQSYHVEIAKLLDGADIPAVIEPVEESTPVDLNIEDDFSTGVSLPSAVNDISLETTKEDKTNLEVIEGIGPKIKEILNGAGIYDFRTLATTPEYRLRDILSAAGPIYAAHDPGSWNEQALLAENGQWDKLEELKARLIAGRLPETPSSTPTVDGSNTEEMLDKVNKVKAAIRKAMVDKTQEEKPKSGSFFDSI